MFSVLRYDKDGAGTKKYEHGWKRKWTRALCTHHPEAKSKVNVPPQCALAL